MEQTECTLFTCIIELSVMPGESVAESVRTLDWRPGGPGSNPAAETSLRIFGNPLCHNVFRRRN